MLEVEQRPDVHRGCRHSASYNIELADEGAEEPGRELVALMERQSRVNLTLEIVALRTWDPELHMSNVHMQAEELERAGGDCHELVGVDTGAKGVQQIDRDLRVAYRLGLVARHRNDVVDVHGTRMPSRHRCRMAGSRNLVAIRGTGARPKGIATHWYFAPHRT